MTGCMGLVKAVLEPGQTFNPTFSPPPPDYAHPKSWAALPSRIDGADVAPPGERDSQARAKADVFYIHPTTFYNRASWNEPLGYAPSFEDVAGVVLPNQASIFNSSARVFAPRYRQATVFAFIAEEREQEAVGALDLAYGDIERAFDHYLRMENHGRPIIIAGHSQGAFHALRLLLERFHERPLRDRLVAAYLAGASVPIGVFDRELDDLPLCERPDQVGCVLTWNTLQEGATEMDQDRLLPIGFVADSERSPARQIAACTNPLVANGEPTQLQGAAKYECRTFERFRASDFTARCDRGQLRGYLRVDHLPDGFVDFPRKLSGNYHVYDFHLFYFDIRRDAERRVQSFLSRSTADRAQ